MTNRQRLGYAIIAAPFVGFFVFVAATMGILSAIGIFVGSAAFICLIALGVDLSA